MILNGAQVWLKNNIGEKVKCTARLRKAVKQKQITRILKSVREQRNLELEFPPTVINQISELVAEHEESSLKKDASAAGGANGNSGNCNDTDTSEIAAALKQLELKENEND